jgi:hydroxymethylpyrimidine pyrophosphatase-like HAD family hydrolase
MQKGFSMTLYLSDLDGTLLSPQAALSPFTAETLRRLLRAGLAFSVATARTRESSQLILAPWGRCLCRSC